jgi:RNA-directed DNA polymerase
VRQLQRTLYYKAKQDKEVKFYSLYDKVYREDILWEAWRQVKANQGAPGVDGETIEAIVSIAGKPMQEDLSIPTGAAGRHPEAQGRYTPAWDRDG